MTDCGRDTTEYGMTFPTPPMMPSLLPLFPTKHVKKYRERLMTTTWTMSVVLSSLWSMDLSVQYLRLFPPSIISVFIITQWVWVRPSSMMTMDNDAMSRKGSFCCRDCVTVLTVGWFSGLMTAITLLKTPRRPQSSAIGLSDAEPNLLTWKQFQAPVYCIGREFGDF
jgi:hypothetical protein